MPVLVLKPVVNSIIALVVIIVLQEMVLQVEHLAVVPVGIIAFLLVRTIMRVENLIIVLVAIIVLPAVELPDHILVVLEFLKIALPE